MGVAPSRAGILGVLRADPPVKYTLAVSIAMGALATVVSTDLLSRKQASELGMAGTTSPSERVAYAWVAGAFLVAQALSLLIVIPLQWFRVD